MPGRPHASITHPPYYHNRQKLPWTLLWQVRLPQHSLSSVQNSELGVQQVLPFSQELPPLQHRSPAAQEPPFGRQVSQVPVVLPENLLQILLQH